MDYQVEVIQPSGILNAISGNRLRQDINDMLLTSKNITILIDLQCVNFIDSSGLGTLVSAMQKVKSSGGELFLCSLSDKVKMLFELTKMERVFKIFKNQDEFNRQIIANKNKRLKQII